MTYQFPHDRPPTNPPHDLESERSWRNSVQAAYLLDRQVYPRCPACREVKGLVPGPADTWVVESIHEKSCPMHDDHDAAYEVYIGDGYDAGTHATAEAVWQASKDAT